MISQKRIDEIKKFFELEEGFENKTLDRHVNLKEFEHLQILRRDFESEAVVVHELLSEVERLQEIISYLPKVPTQPYEKELAKQVESLREENEKLREQRDKEIRDNHKTYAADFIIDALNYELEQLKANQKGE